MPEVEEEAAADEAASDRQAAQQVLDALRMAEAIGRQQVGVETAVGRLVRVVGEEERQQEEQHQPEARHEGDQREAERDRAESDEHEGTPAAERRLERVAPGARSEEHTSELPSHHDLVCRLLLEKKKKTPLASHTTIPTIDQKKHDKYHKYK